ncbi:DUF2490 domain-containing protein [Mucilaginibacter sp. Bleaf8]|uniref:DUF2490 domain-containing protein n=1 Tax=Mucilaginibacter sp. Bleaf8 TaxID=2834430 RepID=UPI001BCCA5DB|nr:DUF2490 domain-containing protein [Mucilaginibacter sp. Bleaf8]MBS7563484.1 DUF2490 domain-containing protein [Mucilaginibacter sp. Bleaf8]
MKKLLLVLLFLFNALLGHAQLTQNMGWLFITHQQKVNSKVNVLADVQLRSANRYAYLTTLLLRSGLSYQLTNNHSVALGYAYKGDWDHEGTGTAYTLENRIFEQYLYKFSIGKTELNARARLEQRWVKEEVVKFSQRARAFVSAQIPLFTDTAFTRGWYAGIQNELFVNIQHKERVNGYFFDQNRSMVSVGYRWSKKIDTELGYLYWYQRETDNAFRRNVVQLMITTQF